MNGFASPCLCRKRMVERGGTLVETMTAAVVFAIGILSLVSAISSTVVVDAISQENNLALDAAREVIEKVKSSPFTDLEAKIAQLLPIAPALDYVPPSTGQLDSQYYYYQEMLQQDPDYWNSYSSPYGTVITDWYGNTIARDGDPSDQDPNDNLYKQPSIVIDHFGDFMVKSLRIAELSPWAGMPATGRVRLAYAKDALGADLTDVIEITVSVRWEGRHGRSEKTFRRQVANWRR